MFKLISLTLNCGMGPIPAQSIESICAHDILRDRRHVSPPPGRGGPSMETSRDGPRNYG